MSKNVLVTGSGGIGGVNFVNALRVAKREYTISGTEFNKYYLELPDIDIKYRTPRHTDPKFLEKIREIVDKDKIDFLHPSPHSEASVIAKEIDSINTKTYLPRYEVIIRDKLETQEILEKNQIPVAKTEKINALNEIKSVMGKFNDENVLVRMKSGAGGKLSLLC